MTPTDVAAAPAGSARPLIRGVRRWYGVLAGIFWWMVHLVAEAALVPASCRHPDLRWVMHAVTLVTALATVLALVWSAQMVRQSEPPDDDEGLGRWGRQRFLGLFGLAVGAISLLLIVWEGSYVVALSSCASY